MKLKHCAVLIACGFAAAQAQAEWISGPQWLEWVNANPGAKLTTNPYIGYRPAPPNGGGYFYGKSVSRPGGYRSLNIPVRVPESPNNNHLIVGSAVVKRVNFTAGKSRVAPNAYAVASCQTARSSVTQSFDFITGTQMARTIGHARGSSTANTDTGTIGGKGGVSILGIVEIGADTSYQMAHTVEDRWEQSHSATWTELQHFRHGFGSGAAIEPGFIATPRVSFPLVVMEGVFVMRNISWQPSAGGNYPVGTFPIGHNGDGTGFYKGVLSIPTAGFGDVRPQWSPGARGMTLQEYKAHCPGDIGRRMYAPAMKAALCRAGYDRKRTCV